VRTTSFQYSSGISPNTNLGKLIENGKTKFKSAPNKIAL